MELFEEDKESQDDETVSSGATTATPKHPYRSRKRTRSQASTVDLLVKPVSDDSQQISSSRNHKQWNKKERSVIIKHIKNIGIMPQLKIPITNRIALYFKNIICKTRDAVKDIAISLKNLSFFKRKMQLQRKNSCHFSFNGINIVAFCYCLKKRTSSVFFTTN